MFRSRSLRPATFLLIAGGLVFALVGWRVLALEQTERERRAMRDSGLAVARGKADADRLAKGPRGRPERSWRVEPIGRVGPELSADDMAHFDRIRRAAGLEGTPSDAMAHYDALLHPEMPTWVRDVAALRSGILLLNTPRRAEGLRRLSRAASAKDLLVDSTKTSVRFRALALLAREGLSRDNPAALRRLLEEAEYGARLAEGEVTGPGRTVVALANDLERTPWWSRGGPDVRRLSDARATAKEGLALLFATPPTGPALVDGRIVFRGAGRLSVFPLASLIQPGLPGIDRGFDLVVVPLGTVGRAGSVALEAPLQQILVIPRPVPPEQGLGLWIAIALGVGLLAYGIGAVAAVRGWRRSAIAAEQQAHFTAAVSHEMKTPIASVRTMAELLADDPKRDPERVRAYGERIDREMQRLGATVRNVLDAAHIERGTLPVAPTPGDPAAFLERVVRAVRPSLEARGFEVHVEAEASEAAVPMDTQALEGVLLNLVDNAAKFSPERRVLDVVGSVRPRGGYRMQVMDRGVGLGSGDPDELFGRYNRGTAAREGAVPGVGLGLHIARQVVEAHGGRLRARHRPGGGAVFELELPGVRDA